MTLSDGAMTPAEQFREIRDTLLRIDGKLDRKADIEMLEPLVRRIEHLESGETPLARQLIRQFEQMQSMVTDLSKHGSANSQLAVNKSVELELRLNQFAEEHATEKALAAERTANEKKAADDRQKHENRVHRIWLGVATSVSALAAIVSALSVLHIL